MIISKIVSGHRNIEEVFQDAFEQGKLRAEELSSNVISEHFGPLSRERLDELVFSAEAQLREKNVQKRTVKAVFSLLVEILQNIRLHGEFYYDQKQWCCYLLYCTNSQVHIHITNLTKKSHESRIRSKIDKVNRLNEEELKDLYMQILTDGKISKKGGAGLGFVTMATKSCHKINYDFSDIDGNLSTLKLWLKIDIPE
ncbi:MAG: DUF6272 family protein [Flavobacteriales bacterium]|nr:DUF6272 family protein [Flavobacteriales bacterium]